MAPVDGREEAQQRAGGRGLDPGEEGHLSNSPLASQTSMLGKPALAEALGRSTAEHAAYSATSA